MFAERLDSYHSQFIISSLYDSQSTGTKGLRDLRSNCLFNGRQ